MFIKNNYLVSWVFGFLLYWYIVDGVIIFLGCSMNSKKSEIQDKRNLVQRIIGVLFLEKCSECNKYAFSAASYGDGGHCSVCGYTTPPLRPGEESNSQ